MLIARAAAIFDLLRVKNLSNMKWIANEKLESALASCVLSGVNLGFGGQPSTIPPSKVVQNDEKI